jgi:hypothetical protein
MIKIDDLQITKLNIIHQISISGQFMEKTQKFHKFFSNQLLIKLQRPLIR